MRDDVDDLVGQPLRAAVLAGDERTQLLGIRDYIVAILPEIAAREKAPLIAQLRAVLADIAALPVVEEASELGDMRARRAAKRAQGTANPGRTAV